MAKIDTTERTIRIGVAGFDGCSAWVTAGILELFAIANVAQQAATRRPRVRFSCGTISGTGEEIHGSHGARFAAVRPRGRYDAVIAPPIWCESREELLQRVTQLHAHAQLLSRLSRQSTIMAGACSGTVLLAEAGLLTRRRATTCWWLADWMQRRFPEIRLDAAKLVVVDKNRWTAAAGSAYLHLCLELVREFAGAEVSAATARLALVEPKRGSQSPFLGRDIFSTADLGRDVGRAARYLEQHLGNPLPISKMCRQLGTTQRTLNRKFRASFGLSPLAYLQSRRIAKAKLLLEENRLPFERIVERCGYGDISSFRKLFAREVGMTPREYRSRFVVVRRARSNESY